MVIYNQAYANTLPRFNRSVSLVSWAYNEEALIEGFVRKADALLRTCVEEYEIVVVDDGSTDRTPSILAGLAVEIPQLRILTNDTNLNVGHSARRAIAAASKEYLFWQTVDWSYDITLLRVFLELLKTNDVIVGVRRAPVQVRLGFFKLIAVCLKLFGVKHLTRRSDTVPKAMVSVINYAVIRLLFGLSLSDYQNVVIYPSRLVQSLTIEADSSFGNPEMLLKAHWRGASIMEVPINFIPRCGGVAKGTRFKAIKASVLDILKFWVKWVVLDDIDKKNSGRIVRLEHERWNI